MTDAFAKYQDKRRRFALRLIENGRIVGAVYLPRRAKPCLQFYEGDAFTAFIPLTLAQARTTRTKLKDHFPVEIVEADWVSTGHLKGNWKILQGGSAPAID